ncbi:AEC family transporter [Orrella daihaiensis]|uniref:AEC family transporter n=1 Tax=Orrella daihaiensis TaxID=2782176 RepID=A0ABY4AG50_9BURK|nr:AEC family transporter [Orrella daihaiensis]UOD49227.1 AEC family transporter [Orrella daihaiensis]
MFAAVINSVVPIFGLIFLGWLCGKRGLLNATATDALNRFVIYLALPALLFVAMARADLNAMAELGFVASFTLGTIFTTLIYVWLSRNDGLADLPRMINGMSVSYANAGFMGIPLILLVFGDQALPIAIIGTVLTVAVQFGYTIVIIEIQRARGRSLLPALKKVALSLLKNPILVATLLGILCSALGISLPVSIVSGIDLLGAAATPCALLTIGLFLAQTTVPASTGSVLKIVSLKLFVHPLAVGVLAIGVFDLDPLWSWCAILATALPVGTGPFMLANLYQQDAALSARAILISTIGSVMTLTALIAWVNIQGIA